MSHTVSPADARATFAWWKPLLFLAVVIIGLSLVKWQPYWTKAWLAADSHSLGRSILADGAATPWQAAWLYAQHYFLAVWKAAVLGVLLGSLVQVLIPRRWLTRTLGRGEHRSTLWGTLLSLPGMMCSCCAAPVAAGLRRCSVSSGAAMAFWLGNPLLNPGTLVFMGLVLGWPFALLRLLAGAVLVVGIAALIQRRFPAPVSPPAAAAAVQGAEAPFLRRWGRALWSLFWATIPVYLLAVLALGAARVWLFPHADGAVDNSLFWVVVMAIAGALFVIPTAAEIPIVQTMLLAGMGTAPALALLITLPALSLPSLLMLRQVFPARALWLALALVILGGIAAGGLSMVL
ncbi:permease [Pantoea sp. 1.19]|uniref:permease n=1 Tax=Pantoea sp. 1.19 TaxID=1925589 RepID=UPI000948FEA6|nr:permease [Pantoea sp. 1.19]